MNLKQISITAGILVNSLIGVNTNAQNFSQKSAKNLEYTLNENTPYDWEKIKGNTSYTNITHSPISFQEINSGLYFSRIDIYKDSNLVDRIVIVKIDPKHNKFRVFSGYDEKSNTHESLTIEEWQKRTGASVLINSAQYQGNPTWGKPCALMICDGEKKGPIKNQSVKGMFLAEPKDSTLPEIQMLDSQYDEFNNFMFPLAYKYNQGVAHWPILLDKQGKIKAKKSNWQASRTAIAKDKQGNILMFSTEGGFFNLYNFGRFLKESNLNIETAMNLDGGILAEMRVRTPGFDYINYGQFETYNPQNDASRKAYHGGEIELIGVFPKE